MTVQVGDRIRLSVMLLRALYDRQDHESETVVVKKILEDADGNKVLWLSVPEP